MAELVVLYTSQKACKLIVFNFNRESWFKSKSSIDQIIVFPHLRMLSNFAIFPLLLKPEDRLTKCNLMMFCCTMPERKRISYESLNLEGLVYT